jgi:hypothetical protein
MTGQIPDTVIYQSQEYDLVGVNGSGLISPEQFGMQPHALHTAAWRGYINTYSILEDSLFLTEMVVGSSEYPVINGVAASDSTYSNLRIEIPFTGGLLAGKDAIGGMYVHMGFQKPHTFETLLEFRFEDGKLISAADLSAKMAAIRQHIREERQAWEAAHRDEIEKGERLQQQIFALRKKIPGWQRTGGDAKPVTDVPEAEILAIRTAVEAEVESIQAELDSLRSRLYPAQNPGRLKQWIEEAFSLEYEF